MRRLARLLCLPLIFVVAGIYAPSLYAQEGAAPFLEVAGIDVTQFPTVRITISGDVPPGDITDLPAAVRERGGLMPLLDDQAETAGIRLAVVLDPYELSAIGASGQTHQAEVAGVLLDLIEQEVIVRGQDQLAVYTAGTDRELQTIQGWTEEPNLLFNSTVQYQHAVPAGEPEVTGLMLDVLDQLEAEPSPDVQAILLFSAVASRIDLETVLSRANEEKVQVHVVDMAGEKTQGANNNILQSLAAGANGLFVRLVGPDDLQPLLRRLAALHRQRVLSYRSSAIDSVPIRVELTLPDGSTLSAEARLPDEVVARAQAAPSAPVDAPQEIGTPTAIDLTEIPPSGSTAPEPSPPPTAPTFSDATAIPAAPGSDDAIELPGTPYAVPRALLQLALPVLLLLLVFLGYRELRDRRTKMRRAATRQQSTRDPAYEPDDMDALQPLASRSAAPYPPVSYPTSHAQPHAEAVEEYEEATVVPVHVDDDEATFRLREQLEQPIVGVLLRVTNDPSLPQKLSIYGLNPAPGEIRRIHIGRHSKNNTVVINDRRVSREHALIVQKDGRLYLCDNASTAGTFLNWRRLKPGEELLLRHNDLISFGEIVYEFRTKGEDEATVVSES